MQFSLDTIFTRMRESNSAALQKFRPALFGEHRRKFYSVLPSGDPMPFDG